jgi:hypothetical protein
MKKFATVVDKETWHDGFQITFGNGYTLSVIFGKSSYSDQGETTAEVAAWNGDRDWMLYSDGKWVVLKDGYVEIMPRCTPDEVAEMMFTLSKE